MLNKKAIAILGAIFLLIIGTLGFLIYQRSSSNTEVAGPTPTPETTPPVLEEPEPELEPEEPVTPDILGGAIKLSDDQVISPVLFFQGNGITYFTGSGQLFQTDIQTVEGKVSLSNKRELTIALKAGINKILWPSSGNNFIAELGSGPTRRWSFYDSEKGAYVDLPAQVTSLAWLPGGQKIVYIWLDSNGSSTLNSSNPDNTDYQTLAEIWEDDDEIVVSPDGENILYYERNNPTVRNPVNLVTSDGKVFRSVVKEGYNQGVLWSPDSKRFVFGRRDPATQKYQLWTADITSGEIKNLGVAGSTDKALWSPDSQSLFAAVPTTAGSGTSLTEDKLVKITITNGATTEYDFKMAVDARNLFLSSSGDIMYFKNFQDGGLYYINLTDSRSNSAAP